MDQAAGPPGLSGMPLRKKLLNSDLNSKQSALERQSYLPEKREKYRDPGEAMLSKGLTKKKLPPRKLFKEWVQSGLP